MGGEVKYLYQAVVTNSSALPEAIKAVRAVVV